MRQRPFWRTFSRFFRSPFEPQSFHDPTSPDPAKTHRGFGASKRAPPNRCRRPLHLAVVGHGFRGLQHTQQLALSDVLRGAGRDGGFSRCRLAFTQEGIGRRGEASDTYAETRCRERLRVRNSSKWLDNYGLEFEELDGPEPSAPSRLSYVGSGHTESFVLEKTYLRRGIYKGESLRVSTRFPFGLIQARRPLSLERHITVFPKVMRVDISFLFRGLSGQVPERQHAGDSEELLRIRDYMKGDDYHHIHWKATAKLGRVMVREFASHEQRRFSVIFDNSAVEAGDSGEARESFEHAVSAAASLVTHLSSHASFFRFISCDEIFPHGASEEHLRGILGHLAVIDINHRPNIDLMEWARQSLRRGDVALILGTEASDKSPWSGLVSSNLYVVDTASLFEPRGRGRV